MVLIASIGGLFLKAYARWGAVAFVVGVTQAVAAVKLALPFTDNMVLQQGKPVPVWGSAMAGESVTVDFAGQTHSVTAATDGSWRVTLTPLKSSAKGAVLKVRGNTVIELTNVLVGEVWLCSGQSNMEVGLDRIFTAKFTSGAQKQEVVARVERDLHTPVPGMRIMRMGSNAGDALKNIWTECSPEALRKQPAGPQGFSAVGFYFGRRLQAELGVPVGLIVAAVGGTVIETWLPPDGKNYRQYVSELVPFSMRGVLWYQGESNVIAADSGSDYAKKMSSLIGGWRESWAEDDLPFYYVQLPPMPYSKRRGKVLLTTEALPQFQEGQAQALRLPHTGMVVTTDLADAPDLHPMNKWEVGERLARLALTDTYRRADIGSSGPVFRDVRKEEGKLIISFDRADDGLISRNSEPLSGFSVAGSDRNFMPADAVIDGNRVIVSCAKVSAPIAVRFGWHEEARPNLINRAGLPARPFRTDDWPVEIVRTETPAAPEILPKD